MLVVGCNQPSSDDTESANRFPNNIQPQLSAAQIWKQTQTAYSTAQTYQDDAVLRLNYRLDGQWIEEYHPQSLSFNRINKSGNSIEHQFHAKIFNSRFSCDSKRLTCFVFDSATGNLDNQVMLETLTDETKLEKFVNDPIANYFVSGSSELPLEYTIASACPILFPPTVGLLTGQTSPDWIKGSNPTARLADLEMDTSVTQTGSNPKDLCYGLEFQWNGHRFVVYVDQTNFLIRKIEFPQSVLSSILKDSESVSDIELTVEFREAVLNHPVDPKVWATDLNKVANPVRQFVKLPESFPSELIGKRIPNFDLRTFSKATIPSLMLKGQTTSLFVVDSSSLRTDIVNEYLTIAEREFKGSTRFALIVCGPEEQAKAMAKAIENRSRKVSVFFDPEFECCRQLKTKLLPAVVIADKATTVHYFKQISADTRKISESWAAEFSGVFDRIDRGDDVATEMHQDYERFLDEYHQNLAAANPSLESVGFQNASSPKQPKFLTLQKSWHVKLNRPGAIIVAGNRRDDQEALYVLDGWQTISKIDKSGKRLGSISLPILKTSGIQKLQQYELANHGKVYLGYLPGNKCVSVFDSRWEKLLTYPKNDSKAANSSRSIVRDAIIAQLGAENPKLFILFADRLEQVDLESGNLDQSIEIESVTKMGAGMNGGAVRLFLSGSGTLSSFDGEDLRSMRIDPENLGVAKSFSTHLANPQTAIAFSSLEHGQTVAQIDDRGGLEWRASIDSREHDWVAILPFEIGIHRESRNRSIDNSDPSSLEKENSLWLAVQPSGDCVVIDSAGIIVDQFSLFSENLCERKNTTQGIRDAAISISSEGRHQLFVSTADSVYSFEMKHKSNEKTAKDNFLDRTGNTLK